MDFVAVQVTDLIVVVVVFGGRMGLKHLSSHIIQSYKPCG